MVMCLRACVYARNWRTRALVHAKSSRVLWLSIGSSYTGSWWTRAHEGGGGGGETGRKEKQGRERDARGRARAREERRCGAKGGEGAAATEERSEGGHGRRVGRGALMNQFKCMR